MKLQFRILWIDDDRGKTESKILLEKQKKEIETYLSSNHFLVNDDTIKIDYWIDLEKFQENYDSRDYDMFLVDFNIGDTKVWYSYIEIIRDQWIYTDIIFYSQSWIEKKLDEYYTLITEKGWKVKFLEGVFLSNRLDLVQKFQNLLDIIDQKVNNLYSMRGLVLAETADLDYILCEIIDRLCDKYHISKISYPLQDNPTKTCPDASTSEKFIRWIQSKDWWNNSNLFYHLTNSASQRWLQAHTTSIAGKLNNYRIFYNKRNDLAHWKTELNADWTMSANGVTYSISELKTMRKQLLEFRACFESFRDTI